jgi:hypothetical protein
MDARTYWKLLYRTQRIAAREARKAMRDMLIYGTSVVEYTPTGARHVPLAELKLWPQ